MEFSEIVQQRRSVKSYDPEKTISDAELKDLFDEVVLSPSAFNLQHWTFIAVKDADMKKKFREAAWGQPQVEESSVPILVCGKLDAFKDALKIYKETPEAVQQRMVPMIHEFYEGKKQLQRDEAIRGASLAAMSSDVWRRQSGMGDGPDDRVRSGSGFETLKADAQYIPVMIVVLGHQKDAPRPRSYRHPVKDVVRLNTLDGPGLNGA